MNNLKANGFPTNPISPLFGICIKVEKENIDVWGHANNVSYIQWMQDVAVEHSAVLGWTADRYLEAQAIWVVQSHTIEYHRSAYKDEKILLQTWIDDIKLVSCFRNYRFIRLPQDATEDEISKATGFSTLEEFQFPQRELLATAKTHWAFVSTKTLRPVKVFQELSEVFENRFGSTAKYPHFE